MKGRQVKSIKDGGGLARGAASIKSSANLGKLMRKHRDLDQVLFPHVSRSDFVYEDMDFSIEEFSDMTGADLNELLDDINKAVKPK